MSLEVVEAPCNEGSLGSNMQQEIFPVSVSQAAVAKGCTECQYSSMHC